jgi:hypothetical protein
VTPLDLRTLLARLHDHRVRCVIIGGVAVAAHGYVRATEDLDVVPDPDRENIGRLLDALRDLRGPVSADDQRALAMGRSVSASTESGRIDIVQRAAGLPTFSELREDGVETELLGVPVVVCSLSRLRHMKRAAGRAQDVADLERLPEG